MQLSAPALFPDPALAGQLLPVPTAVLSSPALTGPDGNPTPFAQLFPNLAPDALPTVATVASGGIAGPASPAPDTSAEVPGAAAPEIPTWHEAAIKGAAALVRSESVAGGETTLSLRSNAATRPERSVRNGAMWIDTGIPAEQSAALRPAEALAPAWAVRIDGVAAVTPEQPAAAGTPRSPPRTGSAAVDAPVARPSRPPRSPRSAPDDSACAPVVIPLEAPVLPLAQAEIAPATSFESVLETGRPSDRGARIAQGRGSQAGVSAVTMDAAPVSFAFAEDRSWAGSDVQAAGRGGEFLRTVSGVSAVEPEASLHAFPESELRAVAPPAATLTATGDDGVGEPAREATASTSAPAAEPEVSQPASPLAARPALPPASSPAHAVAATTARAEESPVHARPFAAPVANPAAADSRSAAAPLAPSAPATVVHEPTRRLLLPAEDTLSLTLTSPGESAAGSPVPPRARAANSAARAENSEGEKEAAPVAPTKTFLSTAGKQVTPRESAPGIGVAKTRDDMPAATLSARPAPAAVLTHPTALPAPVALASRGESPEAAPAGEPSLPVGPTVVAAQRAVEAVLAATDRLASGDRHAVNLQFAVGGTDLAVRVEVRADEVCATFRTDSAELRAALAHEWQAVSGEAADRPFRLAPPVFTTTATDSSGLAAFADGGASRQRDGQARRTSGSVVASVASRSAGRPHAGMPADAEFAPPGRRIETLPTSLHLHAFA